MQRRKSCRRGSIEEEEIIVEGESAVEEEVEKNKRKRMRKNKEICDTTWNQLVDAGAGW